MKKITLILHIGVHKTGTTSIQAYLQDNAAYLESKGYYAPEIKNTEGKLIGFAKVIWEHRIKETIENIITVCTEKRLHTVILSDENLCATHRERMSDIACFGQYFHVKVVLYCRRQDFQLESAYGFLVTWEYSMLGVSADEWLGMKRGVDYYKIASFYKSKIPSCEIVIGSYDFNKKDIVGNFCTLISLPHRVDKTTEHRRNITPNKYIVEILSQLNRSALDSAEFLQIKNFLLNSSSIKDGPKAVFYGDEQRRSIMEVYAYSNRKLQEEYCDEMPIFEDIRDIAVPQGISDTLKQKTIDELNKLHLKKTVSLHTRRENDIAGQFCKRFDPIKNMRIVLYGIGLSTSDIIASCEDFNIIGLYDCDYKSGTIYNKPILNIDHLSEHDIDAVIIVAMPENIRLIYDRISRQCNESQIPLYGVNGKISMSVLSFIDDPQIMNYHSVNKNKSGLCT